jgi:diguanylate cyclase (GGDEF)-like protein
MKAMEGVLRRLKIGFAEVQMRLALWTPPPVVLIARRLFGQARSEYRRNGAFRGAADGCLAFFGLLLIDGLLGWQPALRLMYIVPVWLVAQRAGRFYGTMMVLVTAATTAAIDSHTQPLGHAGLLFTLALRGCVLYFLMRIMEEMEARVRVYSTMATRDALTGVPNRLALGDFARRAVDRCNLTLEPLAIAMVDCDRFKTLNDTYGHEFGDLVLKTLTRCLKKALPAEAFLARNGGDEFVVVLPGRGSDELRKYLDGALVRFLSQAVLAGRCVGFSYGVSAFGVDRKSFELILRAADADMYSRKANRAVVESLGMAYADGLTPTDTYRAAG